MSASVCVPAKFIEPMLLLQASHLPEGAQWIYELKLDGYRALAVGTKTGVQLFSRNQYDLGSRFPQVMAALGKLPVDTVIDGEVVALDKEGRPSFNALQNFRTEKPRIVYFAFDLLTHAGKDLRRQPLSRRLALLKDKVLPKLGDPISLVPSFDAPLTELIASVKAHGLEGLVAKRLDSTYEPGLRSGSWQKMRLNRGQEFVIGVYTRGGTSFDALVLGYYEKGKLLYASKTRNGFTPASRKQLSAHMKPLEIDTCPFADLPQKKEGRWGQGLTAEKMRDCVWLKPKLVGQFSFVEWTPDGHLRHVAFVGMRDQAPS